MLETIDVSGGKLWRKIPSFDWLQRNASNAKSLARLNPKQHELDSHSTEGCEVTRDTGRAGTRHPLYATNSSSASHCAKVVAPSLILLSERFAR